MRVFLAGATGLIGSRLTRLLVAAGHEVVALTRSADKADQLDALGAEPVVGDVFDRDGLVELVTTSRADVVLHELTDLPDDVRMVRELASRNARIRREGTSNLIDALRHAGITRLLAQSIAWTPTGDSAAAVADLERQVLQVGGVVLRYGQFYGPGTYYPDAPPDHPRIHIDAAAARTIESLSAPAGSILTITEGTAA